MTDGVRDNRDRRRYELEVDGQVVYAAYRREGGTDYITYVEAPPSLRGTGAAGRLMAALAEDAKQKGLKITPICGYAAAWLRRSHTYRDLLG